MKAFEIGQGDEVILPTCSFVGAGNAIRHAGAEIALWYMEKFPFSQIAGLELSEILLSDVYNNLQKVSRYKDEKGGGDCC